MSYLFNKDLEHDRIFSQKTDLQNSNFHIYFKKRDHENSIAEPIKTQNSVKSY